MIIPIQSTVHAIEIAKYEMGKSHKTRQFCHMVTLDVKNTFNTTRWKPTRTEVIVLSGRKK